MKSLLILLCLFINICGSIYAATITTESQGIIKNNNLFNESGAVYLPSLITNHQSNAAQPTKNSIAINESSQPTKVMTKGSTATDENDISLADLENASPTKFKSAESSIIDPHENFNRNSYRMNDTLDKNFLRPTTVWYVNNVPGFIRTGAQDFFNNLRDFVTLGNDILQLSTYRSLKDTGRVCINSTIGILGLFDVASHWGMPEHINTFGHTMLFYGWEHSSYVVLPFLGPSTIRDALGMIPDTFFNPTWWLNYPYVNYVSTGLFAVSLVDARAKVLPFDQALNAAIDPYTAMRDFYLQSSGNLPVNSSESSIDEVQIDGIIDEN